MTNQAIQHFTRMLLELKKPIYSLHVNRVGNRTYLYTSHEVQDNPGMVAHNLLTLEGDTVTHSVEVVCKG